MLATSSKQLTKDTTFREAFDAIDFKTPKIRQLYTEDGKPAGYGQVLMGNEWSNAKVLPKDKAGYPIYTCESGSYVCDLEDRIEVNLANGLSKNIWIMECNGNETVDR